MCCWSEPVSLLRVFRHHPTALRRCLPCLSLRAAAFAPKPTPLCPAHICIQHRHRHSSRSNPAVQNLPSSVFLLATAHSHSHSSTHTGETATMAARSACLLALLLAGLAGSHASLPAPKAGKSPRPAGLSMNPVCPTRCRGKAACQQACGAALVNAW